MSSLLIQTDQVLLDPWVKTLEKDRDGRLESPDMGTFNEVYELRRLLETKFANLNQRVKELERTVAEIVTILSSRNKHNSNNNNKFAAGQQQNVSESNLIAATMESPAVILGDSTTKPSKVFFLKLC